MEDYNEKEPSIWSTLSSILGFLVGVFVIFSIFKNSEEKEDPSNKPLSKSQKKNIVKNAEGIVDSTRKVLDINKRQGSILAEIEQKGKMTPAEIYKLQPEVSTRTLRRDMDVLVKEGVVKQEGSTKSTKYTYIG